MLTQLREYQQNPLSSRQQYFAYKAQAWLNYASHFRMVDRWLEQTREAYINAHDSQTNVELERLINSYYKQFAPLDPSDNSCRGQVLPLQFRISYTKISNTRLNSRLSLAKTIPIPTPTAAYRIVH